MKYRKETLTTPWTRHPRCGQSLVPEDKWSYSAFILLFVEKFLRKPKRPFNEFYGKKTFVINRYLVIYLFLLFYSDIRNFFNILDIPYLSLSPFFFVAFVLENWLSGNILQRYHVINGNWKSKARICMQIDCGSNQSMDVHLTCGFHKKIGRSAFFFFYFFDISQLFNG